MYRSDDGTRSFRMLAPIQPDTSHHDRAELITVGRDVALVYSYEGASLGASRKHDVWFQWWRYHSNSDTWRPEPAVRVFDAHDDSTAYSRALLARDSMGRLWIQAFKLERDGRSTAVISVSTDGGYSFHRQPDLGSVRRRGGGRLLSVGSKLVFVYAMHDGYEPTRMRIRHDSDPLNTWGAVRQAFPEGIYHGAALSAVADGRGGMHLVYKDEHERLYHRYFNGSSFGPRTLLENSRDWAMQSAITRVGDRLYVFYNVMRVPNKHHELHVRVLENGRFSEPVVLDTRATFKGYLASFESLPEGSAEVPCFFGDAPDANSRGHVARVALAVSGDGSGEEEPPPADPDPDPTPGQLLFSDSFSRSSSNSFGRDWTLSGLWLTNGQYAVSDLDNLQGDNLALASSSRCGDCQVEAWMHAFGEDEAAVVLRAQGDARYALVLLGDGRIQLRRYREGSFTVLGEATRGRSDPWDPVTLTLSARGSGPVTLSASVDGKVRLTVKDADPDAIGGEGLAGFATPIAGTWFDNFTVRSVRSP